MKLWNNSKCKAGWFHRYKMVGISTQGVMEHCEICKKTKFFPMNIDNLTYLSYHLREALPTYHPSFLREYPQFNGKI